MTGRGDRSARDSQASILILSRADGGGGGRTMPLALMAAAAALYVKLFCYFVLFFEMGGARC